MQIKIKRKILSLVLALSLVFTIMPFGAFAAVMNTYTSIEAALASGNLTLGSSYTGSEGTYSYSEFIVDGETYNYYGDGNDDTIYLDGSYSDAFELHDLYSNAVFKYGDGYMLIKEAGDTSCDVTLHNADMEDSLSLQLNDSYYDVESYVMNLTLEGDNYQRNTIWADNLVITGSGNLTADADCCVLIYEGFVIADSFTGNINGMFDDCSGDDYTFTVYGNYSICWYNVDLLSDYASQRRCPW